MFTSDFIIRMKKEGIGRRKLRHLTNRGKKTLKKEQETLAKNVEGKTGNKIKIINKTKKRQPIDLALLRHLD